MKPNQEQRRKLWRKIIAQQESTGQPIRAFCRERGVNEHMFYAWRQRLLSENKPVTFALIETTPEAATEAAAPPPPGIELRMRTGDSLYIPSDPATLRLVLNVLREQPGV
jgi:transposase-like protein